MKLPLADAFTKKLQHHCSLNDACPNWLLQGDIQIAQHQLSKASLAMMVMLIMLMIVTVRLCDCIGQAVKQKRLLHLQDFTLIEICHTISVSNLHEIS